MKGHGVFRWGANGEHEADFSAPTILSIPTWIFRGFTNVSKEDTCGMVFTVLGGDNTGGIIWHFRQCWRPPASTVCISARIIC